VKGSFKMRKLLCLFLLILAGCRSTAGQGRPDDPSFSIAEQQSRARAGLAIPDDFSGLAPKTGAAVPGSGFSAR
jgi:hypothetical protein